ncbi:related to isoflavone reductase family protein [Phialocephala subalpina]|uniref:Related to isoflavone reductase family protein n=1 Tax=Phialocephala subalpina TaxID=576137 RepID=A0A1L7X919_9HELO|nr:related to isoflavone reductase family protein [Phialocephala subalpina]
MTKPRVLLIGATGRTGGSILNCLLEAGNFSVEVLIRPSSSTKPSVLALKDLNIKIHIAEISDSTHLAEILTGINTVISAIGPTAHNEQIPLANAAKKAGVKRFVPCGFTTVAPPGNIMWIRDHKEEIYQHIRKLHLPYTIIDVGIWYQVSFPTVPSGRTDYASILLPNVTILGDPNMKTAITDIRDIGTYVAEITADERTLNKFVFVYGELLSQEEVFGKVEELSGEKLERVLVPPELLLTLRDEARAFFQYDFSNMKEAIKVIGLEYAYSKFVRNDNCPDYAKYLGYLDARDLYPEFVPRTFEDFVRELLEGKAAQLFAGESYQW